MGEKKLVSWCFEPSQPQRITSGLRGEKKHLQGVEDGEEIVEDDAGLVDGEDGKDPGQTQQNGHAGGAAQLLGHRERVGLVQLALGHAQDLAQDQREGQEVDEQDQADWCHEGAVERHCLQPASAQHTFPLYAKQGSGSSLVAGQQSQVL